MVPPLQGYELRTAFLPWSYLLVGDYDPLATDPTRAFVNHTGYVVELVETACMVRLVHVQTKVASLATFLGALGHLNCRNSTAVPCT